MRSTTASDWTAIIPAAGSGTRLGYPAPKLLYPLLGKPIIEWLVRLLDPFCAQYVFVLSPRGEAQVRPHLEALLPGRFRIVLQASPSGMADAVYLAREAVQTAYCLILWSDQVAIRPETIRACIQSHMEQGSQMTFPTFIRKNPYIHFYRDGAGRLTGVYQRREEDIPLDSGESDCGLFLFTTRDLFSTFERYISRPELIGRRTGEKSFLAFFPFFDQNGRRVTTLSIASPEESQGINTPEEARLVEHTLSCRERQLL